MEHGNLSILKQNSKRYDPLHTLSQSMRGEGRSVKAAVFYEIRLNNYKRLGSVW